MKTCKQRGCKRAVHCRGLCHADYQALSKANKLNTRRVFCELCNVTGQSSHAKSLSHRKMKRFKKLLEQNCISLSEIGRRLGYSREMARQLAERFQVKGMQRLKACTVTRHETMRRKAIESSTFIKAAKAESEARGWQFEPLSKRLALINGKSVRFSALTQARGYLQTSTMKNFDSDFGVFMRNGCWLIIPAHQMANREQVMFAVEPRLDSVGMKRSARHDWRQFINAFHFLE